MVDHIEIEPVWSADDERQIASALATLLEKAAELDRFQRLAVTVQQRHERSLRQPPPDVVVLADLDQLELDVTGQELLVMPDVVGKWRP